MMAFVRGDVETAAATLPAAIEASTALGEPYMEAALLVGQGSLAVHSGRMTEAISFLEHAAEQYRRAELLPAEADVLTLLARTAAAAGRSDDAEQYGRDAVARAEASGSVDAVAEARATLGRIALNNGHLELADEALCTEITPIRMHASSRLAEARAHLALHRGDDANAEHNFRAALEAYRSDGAPWEVAEVSLQLGKLGRRAQNWALALTGFEAADRLGDARQRAAAALGVAGLAVDRGEWTAASADQFTVAIQMLLVAGDATLWRSAASARPEPGSWPRSREGPDRDPGPSDRHPLRQERRVARQAGAPEPPARRVGPRRPAADRQPATTIVRTGAAQRGRFRRGLRGASRPATPASAMNRPSVASTPKAPPWTSTVATGSAPIMHSAT